jgi:hypothetical protein
MADLPHPHLLFLRATRKSRQLLVIKKISNASKLKTRLLTVAFAKDSIGMPGNPAKVRLSTRKAVLVPKDIIIPQKSYKAKREYKSATPLSDLQRILRKL